MTELRYPFSALRADYVRTAIGLVLALGPALMVPAGSAALYVLLPAALLFLAFGFRTWRRQISRVRLDETGISLFSPRRVSLAWHDIRALKLGYYAVRADRTGGWMQLTLKGAQETIRIDSSLDGFEQVVRRAASAAQANTLDLSEATRANLAALGIAVAESSSSAEAAA